jgi:glycosyltransferase involved in cell wall biosynthesis
MSHPLVSIIIPTYRRTDYLRLLLESIIKQTFQDFEVLVIDDGTLGDENQQLCSCFDKVLYHKIANSGGPAKPRNVGISKARGIYLAFVDDDDIWLPHKLSMQVGVLENNLDFGLVHGCCEVIDKEGVLQNKIIGRPGTPNVKHGDVSLQMMGNWTVMMPTSFIRKEVVDRVGFFNEDMPAASEDTEYWTRCSFETKFYYIDVPLVYYRLHFDNISRDKRKYLLLPLYLKSVLNFKLSRNIVDRVQYKLLQDNLCKMQIKKVKYGFFTTIKNLFVLDLFWLCGKNNFKMLVYILLLKK